MRMTLLNGGAWSLLVAVSLFSIQAASAADAPSAVSTAPSWVAGEQSSGKRPIEVARFGQGTRYVLIVGSVSGNDPESIALLDAICRMSSQFPPPEPVSLLLIRTPNPDGMADHVHTNSNGVDLDRNFPSRNFTLSPNRLTGPHPASETETKYLLRVVNEFKPLRIVHIRSGVREQPIVLLNEKWQADSGSAVLPPDVPQSRYHYAFKAGSLEEFADSECKTAVATVVLSTGSRKLQPAEILRLAVGNLVEQTRQNGALVESPEPAKKEPEKSNQMGAVSIPVTIPVTPSTMPSANPVEVKSVGLEVQLLPPPPVFVKTSKSARQTSTGDGRYQDLPTPPKK